MQGMDLAGSSAFGPTVLTVPGFGGSGVGHWQTIWEQTRGDTHRAELGHWNAPRRNPWVTALDQAIRAAEAPVILAAHSLGCVAVAWWAALAGQPWGWPVAGALLVAPPDVERPGFDRQVGAFGPTPDVPLPFPSFLVASHDDEFCTFQRSCDMAKLWGSSIVDAGCLGHINAATDLGAWADGQALIDLLAGANGNRVQPPAFLGQAAPAAGLQPRL